MDGDVNLRRLHAGYHLLIVLRRVVEKLNQELTGLAVLAARNDGHLVELLSNHPAVVERIFKPVPGKMHRNSFKRPIQCDQIWRKFATLAIF